LKPKQTTKQKGRKMKTKCRNWLVLLSLMIGTGGAWAQTLPPGLIGNLHVVGIQKWDITNEPLSYVRNYPPGAGVEVSARALSQFVNFDDNTPCYFIKMTVSIDNIGKENVLFEDPQLDVRLMQLNEKGELLGVGTNGPIYRGTNAPMVASSVDLGMARLVKGEQVDWEAIANVLAPENGQKNRETQLQFEIPVGPNDLEHAQRMITAFHIMNDQDRRWLLWLRGTAKVGTGDVKGDSTAMVFSSTPVEVNLKSKPAMPQQLLFPK
jgi:hypothetical protein